MNQLFSDINSNSLLLNLGLLIRTGRKQKGYSQEEFAQELAISRATLVRLEKGGNTNSFLVMEALRLLGISNELDVFLKNQIETISQLQDINLYEDD